MNETTGMGGKQQLETTIDLLSSGSDESAGTRLFFGPGTSRPIRHAAELAQHLPADRRHHYRDGYSMAEAAKCWVAARGRLPGSVAPIVGSDRFDVAHFEYPVLVWGGGTSMTDVMVFGPDWVVAVEAKAREPFGCTVSEWIVAKAAVNPRSEAHRRGVVGRYADALGVPADMLSGIRYQLLHRTLSAAMASKTHVRRRAFMVVQSFCQQACDEQGRNLADFQRFTTLVGTEPRLGGVPVRLGWAEEAVA